MALCTIVFYALSDLWLHQGQEVWAPLFYFNFYNIWYFTLVGVHWVTPVLPHSLVKFDFIPLLTLAPKQSVHWMTSDCTEWPLTCHTHYLKFTYSPADPTTSTSHALNDLWLHWVNPHLPQSLAEVDVVPPVVLPPVQAMHLSNSVPGGGLDQVPASHSSHTSPSR